METIMNNEIYDNIKTKHVYMIWNTLIGAYMTMYVTGNEADAIDLYNRSEYNNSANELWEIATFKDSESIYEIKLRPELKAIKFQTAMPIGVRDDRMDNRNNSKGGNKSNI